MSERLPPPRSAQIRGAGLGADEVLSLAADAVVVRIHPLDGPHRLDWNEFRAWGPTRSRFDHHTLPRREHPRRSVMYLTIGTEAFTAAIAEFFQDDGGGVGPIDRTLRRPAVTLARLQAPVSLLDLDSGWITRAGGNQAIGSGSRARARAWARAVYRCYPDLDGLAYHSSVWGPGRCVVLWERARRSLSSTPLASRTLDDPLLAPALAEAAEQLGAVLL